MKPSRRRFLHVTVLVTLTILCGCNRSANETATQETEVNVRSVAVSPDKTHIATSYTVSGGGAAGFVYKCVNVRAATEPFAPTAGVVFQMSGNSELAVRWEADGTLIVEHPTDATVLTSDPDWKDGTATVRIRYVPR